MGLLDVMGQTELAFTIGMVTIGLVLFAFIIGSASRYVLQPRKHTWKAMARLRQSP